ncbi:MAG: ribose 5-phosphate isomerase A [Spirochaetaceae bacterium]|nr:ribose 5-phosphate isomerase A [Spirochaetaceae bacterium]
MRQPDANKESKRLAALEAVRHVKDGMAVGLGTGSTAALVIEELGRLQNTESLNCDYCVTSYQSMQLALEAGLKVFPVETFQSLDISIDGADEVDPALNLIKGGGAAHTLEKIVHSLSSSFICVVDGSKLVSKLGERTPVPLEVLPQAINVVRHELDRLGAREVSLRMALRKDGPVITDHGNFVLDVRFESIHPEAMEKELNSISGVVENGIFAKCRPSEVIVGESSGVRTLKP